MPRNLSAEYLPGPHLGNNILNLDLVNQVREAMADLDINYENLIDQEEEPGDQPGDGQTALQEHRDVGHAALRVQPHDQHR